jgi:hypothetical protein
MNTRRASLALLVLLLPAAAHADRHKIGFRGGWAWPKRSSLDGLQLALDVPLKGQLKPGGRKVFGTLGVVADLSWANGTHEEEPFSQSAYLGGLSYSVNKLADGWLQPSVSLKLGVVREEQASVRRSSFAFTSGVGLYLRLVSINDRVEIGVAGHYDYYHIASPTNWYHQPSVGLVVRLE